MNELVFLSTLWIVSDSRWTFVIGCLLINQVGTSQLSSRALRVPTWGSCVCVVISGLRGPLWRRRSVLLALYRVTIVTVSSLASPRWEAGFWARCWLACSDVCAAPPPDLNLLFTRSPMVNKPVQSVSFVMLKWSQFSSTKLCNVRVLFVRFCVSWPRWVFY